MLTIDHTQGNQARLSWLLYDGHGNLVRTMASNYALSSFQWRGVWGEVQGSLGVGRGYCANLGHPEDETGLVYMRARYYEPATGRFISEDPARDGVNWYLYADGNPANKVDVDGKFPWTLVVTLGAAALGFLLGIVAGYSFGVNFYRSQDSSFAGGRRSEYMLTVAWLFTFTGVGEAGALAWMHYKQIPFAMPVGLLRGLGIAGAIGFVFGFTAGAILASLDFEEHRQAVEGMMMP
ncbi:RHS repeat-associated core domain-containing protein [Armatimonadetes bacterium GBS]|nr:MAG: hypothetical protein KatS3mg021_2347 [Fimbriimonadales bacterium]CUU09555.1 RHS repeat-associated core domain-containing protein [Armatimonadetes bacterium GBS]CUU35148.1 RHS repeat-associated core domain-containing protein [Armatimonadetes bacterium GXS]